MAISLETVKELREKTNAGMMDCKRALQESDGDLDAAVDCLRKKGLATAAKKAGRVAAEGTIVVATSGNVHALVDVNCETDFVTKTEDFQNYSKEIADVVVSEKPADLDALLTCSMRGKTAKDVQTDIVAKIGENIHVRRFEIVEVGGSDKITQYVHPGSKIAVLALFDDPNGKLDDQLAREIAMHVAAMNPMYVRGEDVPADFIEKEKEIFMEQMANEKKPPEIMEKIIQGKVAKQLKDICLEDQAFVKSEDGKTSVKNTLKNVDPGIKIKSFVRLQVGEGVEKKKADLAQEVAEMVNK